MATKTASYSYSVETQNRFSLLEGTRSPLLASKPLVKAPVAEKKEAPSANPKAEKKTNKPQKDKVDSKDTKIVAKGLSNNPAANNSTQKKQPPVKKTKPMNASEKQMDNEAAEMIDSVEISPEVKENSRRRKDVRKDLGPKGLHRRDPNDRIFDRGEHSNVIMGRGKKSEKRHGHGKFNWGGSIEQSDVADAQESLENHENLDGSKSIEVDATPIMRSKRPDRRPPRGENDNRPDSRKPTDKKWKEKEEEEDNSISLDEYKANCEKVRLKPKKMQEKQENEAKRQSPPATTETSSSGSDDKKHEKKNKKQNVQFNELPADGVRSQGRGSNFGNNRGGFSRGGNSRGSRRPPHAASGSDSVGDATTTNDSASFDNSNTLQNEPRRDGERPFRPRGDNRGGSAFRGRPRQDGREGEERKNFRGGFNNRGGSRGTGNGYRGSSRNEFEPRNKSADVVLDISDFPCL